MPATLVSPVGCSLEPIALDRSQRYGSKKLLFSKKVVHMDAANSIGHVVQFKRGCVTTAADEEGAGDEKKPKKKKKAKKFPKDTSRGPGTAPMYMQTDEQRKADKQFRRGGADEGLGGGVYGGSGDKGRGGGGGDEGGWFANDDGEANPIGLLILGLTAIGAYFYYKSEKEKEEERAAEAEEARRQALLERRRQLQQAQLQQNRQLVVKP